MKNQSIWILGGTPLDIQEKVIGHDSMMLIRLTTYLIPLVFAIIIIMCVVRYLRNLADSLNTDAYDSVESINSDIDMKTENIYFLLGSAIMFVAIIFWQIKVAIDISKEFNISLADTTLTGQMANQLLYKGFTSLILGFLAFINWRERSDLTRKRDFMLGKVVKKPQGSVPEVTTTVDPDAELFEVAAEEHRGRPRARLKFRWGR